MGNVTLVVPALLASAALATFMGAHEVQLRTSGRIAP